MIPKIDKAIAAFGTLIRVLDAHRFGAILFIIMQLVVALTIVAWKK